MDRTRKALCGLWLLSSSCSDPETQNDPPAVPVSLAGPSAYTAKVKNLLTGQAPTDTELQAVTKDEKALAGLIDGWMETPAFRGKMLDFFKQAFQQTQISLAEFDEQLGRNTQPWNPTDKARFLYSAQVSFPLTALQLIAEGRPFTEVLTTERFMLNPPLMSSLAWIDGVVVDDNGAPTSWVPGKFGDKLRFVRQKDAPIPFADSIDPANANFLTFYDPQPYMGPNTACATYPFTIDPSKAPSPQVRARQTLAALVHIADVLYGGRPACGNTVSQFSDADWNDWRMITVRAPKAGEDRALFWDLPAFRAKDAGKQELVVNTPRVGFLTTPAFLANWPTNLSNLSRVTVNQALIVGLGRSLADATATVPVSETGKPDAAHSEPGTTCYNCHKTLDPMRNFYRQSFSVSYHTQTLALPPEQQQAAFLLDDVNVKGTGIKDLAAAMAAHPRFATAWTQKLCQYANSSACSPADPEFLRVADVFQKSGFQWKTLVRELFSSPLVTQSRETQTLRESGTVITVSRREHFCTALQNRLGLLDACGLLNPRAGVVQNLAFGIPGAGYSRGAEAPLLPYDPDLFFTASVENLCGQMAAVVVEPAACKTGARCWTSAKSAEALTDFVGIVMGAAPSDPRHADLRQILSDHFTDASKTERPADALRSTFVLACSSPLASSMGL